MVDIVFTPPRGNNRPDVGDRGWRALNKSWADVHVFLTTDFVVDWVSPSVYYVLGWRPSEMIGRNYEDFVHPDLADEGFRMAMDMLRFPNGFDPADGNPDEVSVVCPAHVVLRRADGKFMPMESRGNIHFGDASIGGVHLVLRDVTDLHAQDRLLSLIAADAPVDEVCHAIVDTVVTQVPGTSASIVSPGADGEAIEVPSGSLESHDRQAVLACVNRVLQSGSFEFVSLTQHTPWHTVWILPLKTPDPPVCMAALLVWTESDGAPVSWVESILVRLARLGSIGLARISDLEQLRRAAAVDPLTGIANRREFERSLLLASRQATGRWAVFYLDLDNFKDINDRFGHAIGDEVLLQTATRLSGAIRLGDIAARIGGDEFTILCSNLSSDTDALVVAERIRAAMNRPMSVRGVSSPLTVGASMGFALTENPEEVGHLMDLADDRMYDAKNGQRTR